MRWWRVQLRGTLPSPAGGTIRIGTMYVDVMARSQEESWGCAEAVIRDAIPAFELSQRPHAWEIEDPDTQASDESSLIG